MKGDKSPALRWFMIKQNKAKSSEKILAFFGNFVNHLYRR